MSTIQEKPTLDQQERADHEAAEGHFIEGTPFETELARRIQERADQVSERIVRTRGFLDEETVNQLLRDDRDEA
jgi:hypothetical protein